MAYAPLIHESDKEEFDYYCKHLDMSVFPREAKKKYEMWSPEDRLHWLEMRFMCLKYPLFLGGYYHNTESLGDIVKDEYVPIMGMDFQEQPHAALFQQFIQFQPGSGKVLSDLSQQIKKFMILWSRGLFKTSAIIVVMTQMILNYPNVRILFLTGGDKLAMAQEGRLKKVFERPTPLFCFLFPEFCLKTIRNRRVENEESEQAWKDISPKMGTTHNFTVPARTMEILAESTFTISTSRSVKAGSHYDAIFIDDLVNETNYRSVPALEKCYEDYLGVCPLLDPSGFMFVTGTRYSFGDTYERIQEKSKEEERQLGRTIWRFSIRDCWDSRCQHCSHRESNHDRDINIAVPPCAVRGCSCGGYHGDGTKEVLFPETRSRDGRAIGHTLEFLEGEKIRLGPDFFSCQYENNPIAAGTQTFEEALIGSRTLFEEKQLPDYLLGTTFIVGDLAYVGQPGRDYTVMFVCRLVMGRIYVIACKYGNWDSDAIATNTMKLVQIFHPSALYYEKFNGWDAYNAVILAKAKELGIENLPLQWIKGTQTPNAKMVRIGAVKGPLAAGRLWLYKYMDTQGAYEKLTTQLIRWPKLGKHDDFADALGLVIEAPTGYQFEQPPVQQTTTNWLRQMNPRPTGEDSYYDSGMGNGLCG